MGIKTDIQLFLQDIRTKKSEIRINKLIADIEQFDLEGDLYKFLSTFFNNEKRIKLNNELIDSKGKKLFDIIESYNNEKMLTRNLLDIEEGNKYNSFQLSAMMDNFNTNIGMYHIVISGEHKVLLKANITQSEERYVNKWIEIDKKLKYFLMREIDENFTNRNYTHKVNRIIYESYIMDEDIEIFIFTRNSKREKYEFKGIFSVLSLSDDGTYIELIKNSEIKIDDIVKNESIKSREEEKIKIFEDQTLYNLINGKSRKYQGLFRKKF